MLMLMVVIIVWALHNVSASEINFFGGNGDGVGEQLKQKLNQLAKKKFFLCSVWDLFMYYMDNNFFFEAIEKIKFIERDTKKLPFSMSRVDDEKIVMWDS